MNSLPKEEVASRMEKMINSPQIVFKCNSYLWFDEQHPQELTELQVFQDERMDDLLVKIIQLPSSQKSLCSVVRNIIFLLWRSRDTRHLTATIVLTNPLFQNIFHFLSQRSSVKYKRSLIHHVLEQIQKSLRN